MRKILFIALAVISLAGIPRRSITAESAVLAAPPKNVLVNDTTTDIVPYIAQREPAIAVSGSNIVVGFNDERYRLSETLRGVHMSVGYAFSSDGGSTFTDAGELGTSHWGADPSAAADRHGNFYFGRIDLDGIAVYKSTDGGVTFPQRTIVGKLAGTQDKPFITVNDLGGPFDGSVYVTWTNAVKNVLNIVFSRSTDGGVSFSDPIRLTNSILNQGSMPVVGPDGELYVVWFDSSSGAGKIFIRRSTDGGATFDPPTLVATPNAIGAHNSTCSYCGAVLKGDMPAGNPPIIAVDRGVGATKGRIYIAFSANPDGSSRDLSDVYLTSSSDGASTWTPPLRINDDTTNNDQWFPYVAVSPRGVVAVMWYDRRLDPNNALFDVFMSISTDGGASFAPNFRITDASSSPPGPDTKLGFPPCSCSGADYNYMVADGRNFYLVWTDDRMSKAGLVDQNIFFAKVPIQVRTGRVPGRR